ncbi:hypothetical protein BU17DRAFT_96946 [Hysterangium stoloniferum]|nr:hypothetical protein BU17DRAFT_96946 [Hysterangium stoloniferum]
MAATCISNAHHPWYSECQGTADWAPRAPDDVAKVTSELLGGCIRAYTFTDQIHEREAQHHSFELDEGRHSLSRLAIVTLESQKTCTLSCLHGHLRLTFNFKFALESDFDYLVSASALFLYFHLFVLPPRMRSGSQMVLKEVSSLFKPLSSLSAGTPSTVHSGGDPPVLMLVLLTDMLTQQVQIMPATREEVHRAAVCQGHRGEGEVELQVDDNAGGGETTAGLKADAVSIPIEDGDDKLDASTRSRSNRAL